ncbi:hypothetical protein [Methylobacterium frigidaeris]|uniref:DUF4440 domain-containing protein n=1 Tax=Methylobacterium frigidaeris TaxID=2038277 RepID=A0AA37H891_9HYPH|nr:hypothetical protein [Methylobacterium frigidaeris]PIK74369.1 hypothetical protein CS379_02965 [Methylobacterium frigidaeris]GJD61242.1 hypothetical protein MPEAHAMD_1382 [Methylobacterium frigidaeris]
MLRSLRFSLSRPSAALLGLGLTILLSPAALAQGWVDPPNRTAQSPAAKDPAPARTPPAPAPRFAPAARAEAPKAHTPRRVAEEARRPARSGLHAATAARRAARLARDERPLPVQIPAPAPAPIAVSDGQVRDWAVASQRLARDYLASISGSNGAALAAAPGFYGDRVVFHGRPMSLASLMSEKRRFVQRWPERRYRPRPDSLRTACNAGLATCRVQATVDFSAFSPDRGVRSQGTVDLELAVSFAGGRPVIVSENSRVVHRDAVASR